MSAKGNQPEIITTKSGRKLAIIYRSEGQGYGTVAELRSGREIIAATDAVPLGFTGAARALALELAEKL